MYTPFVDQQFGYVRFTARPCGDQYWAFWSDHYSVLVHLYAMPRGLHASLCHAFLTFQGSSISMGDPSGNLPVGQCHVVNSVF